MQDLNKNNGIPFTNNQKIILKYRRYFSYLFYVIVFICFLTFFDVIPTSVLESISKVWEYIGVVFTVIFIGFFSSIVLGFLIHFIKMQTYYGVSSLKVDGKIILNLVNKSGITGLIGLLLVAGLTVLVNLIVFKNDIFFDPKEVTFSFSEKLALGFFYVLAHFLLVVFTFRSLNKESYFTISEKGFLYNPAGISFGMVLWKDVTSIRETVIMRSLGMYAPLRPQKVLTIGLANADEYNDRYNIVLRSAIKLINKFNKYQTEGDADLIIDTQIFKDDEYELVLKLMKKYSKLDEYKIY